MTHSRRTFFTASLGAAAGLKFASAQAPSLTAKQVVERIQKNLGVPWREGPTDTFKTGDPDAPVKGIATTMMTTLDVLQRAAAAGKNMIITHEPTFWTGNDDVRQYTDDRLYKQKLGFIKEHGLIIWRFHDNLHARQPDMSAVGLAQDLGWDGYSSKTEKGVYVLPPTTLRELAKDVDKRMHPGGLRVIGDPNLKVTRAGLMQGAAPFPAARVFANVDVIVAGEQREWEGVEYAFDANPAGDRKGMIIIGHWISEEGGMRLCAAWLKTFITEVPIEWIPAGDPFWRP